MKMVDPETLQLWANPYTGVLQTSEIAVDVEIPANGAARYYGSIRAVGGGGLDVVNAGLGQQRNNNTHGTSQARRRHRASTQREK